MATANQQAELVAAITASVIAEMQKAGTVQVATKEARPRPAIKVQVNEGTATKYGDLTIGKEADGGKGFLPKIGVHVEDVDALIKALRAAKKEVLAQG